MLLIDKTEHGIKIDIRGGQTQILAELGVLVATVQESIGDSINIYEALNHPIQRCLIKAYVKAMREGSNGKNEEPIVQKSNTGGKE